MSTYQTIPLKALAPSENNYRRSSDQTAFDELVASVRAKGILQPILVRPKGKKFEIVAGHRRHKAALEAGLKEMPAIVRELDDEEALEVQVIENTQREDPNPMDEAVGFKRLLEMGKHTPETLAEKIGHTTKYVLARTRLLGLNEEAQELVASGELSIGHALVVSRLKNHDDQKKLTGMILAGDGMTVRQAATWIDSFSADLASADFPLDGCEKCTARTRNQADLFPALKDAEDECMDRECFQTKTLYHWSGWIEDWSAKGFPVFLSEEEMPKMASHGRGAGVALIAPSTEGKKWQETFPPKYEARCAKCKTHHGFYLYEKSYASGHKEITRGEICLSADCLDEMLKKEGPKAADKGDARGTRPDMRMGKYQRERLAENCMKRFLSGELSKSGYLRPTLKKQMETALLFSDLVYSGDLDEFLKEFLPEYDQDKLEDFLDDTHNVWRVITDISLNRLDEAKDALLRIHLAGSDLPFLNAVAADADIDPASEFTIDAEYLEEFEGEDLRELVAELWPDAVPLVLTDIGDTDDEKVRELILAQDLKGRLPKELAEEQEDTGEENDDFDEDGGECF